MLPRTGKRERDILGRFPPLIKESLIAIAPKISYNLLK